MIEDKNNLAENGKIVIEIRVAYRPGTPMLIGGAAGTHWITNRTEIKRVVVTSSAGISDEETIKNSAERLAKETCRDFFSLIGLGERT